MDVKETRDGTILTIQTQNNGIITTKPTHYHLNIFPPYISPDVGDNVTVKKSTFYWEVM